METFYFLEKALLSLTKAELKRFEKFLNAVYFKKKHSRFYAVFIFYKLIKRKILKAHKRFPDTEWSKIILDIYPDKKNDENFCKKYLILHKSELLTYLLDFMVIESFIKDKISFKISILNELKKRNLTDIFDHYCKIEHSKELKTIYHEL